MARGWEAGMRDEERTTNPRQFFAPSLISGRSRFGFVFTPACPPTHRRSRAAPVSHAPLGRSAWGTGPTTVARGCRVRPDEAEAAKWCGDYDHWIVGLKARVAGKLGTTEVISIFQIGPGLVGIQHAVGVTIEHQRRMACLKIHMEELKEALKRSLPGSQVGQ